MVDKDTRCLTARNRRQDFKNKKNMNKIYLWWIRNFKVISNQKAKELGLEHYRNIYGDEINHLNCRSLWVDKKKNVYRVSHLEHYKL
jgi:hypothetical protein